MVGLLSLPTELICHILLFLTPRDLSRCTTTCKTVLDAARNSVLIQYKLELHVQGFTETATLDLISVSGRLRSLEKLASLWRSDFRAKTIFERVGSTFLRGETRSAPIQCVKCGLWWMWAHGNLFIRNCNGNLELSRTWRTDSLSPQYIVKSVIVDPLQDLVVAVSEKWSPFVPQVDAEQDHCIFLVAFRLASSGLPYLDSALECRHIFYEPGHHSVRLLDQPAICGDRVVVLYCTYSGRAWELFIQVIDWRTGRAKSHEQYPLRGPKLGVFLSIHLVDEHTIVVVGGEGSLSLYTLRALDGSPQHRATYLLPDLRSSDCPRQYLIHATPSFHGVAARPDLMPGYVLSPESQIMVLKVLSETWDVILVIDMVIFSQEVVHSETPVTVPWSDWGPKYTCCFPYYSQYTISVFGSKIAFALPWDRARQPGETLEELSDDHDHFYVHIWDFNERVISRAENARDRSPPHPLIYIVSHRAYTATVCRTPFMKHRFDKLFLEQDRFILTWHTPGSLADIQVVCPVVGMDLAAE
ncbi:hypothetical protein M405DRAFT_842965 [Rhizopogon salebrosus TDB-379]|nr:hypothetical protein M405DRAFT_842965 [Rhizopogon salebrosus TDB-379]